MSSISTQPKHIQVRILNWLVIMLKFKQEILLTTSKLRPIRIRRTIFNCIIILVLVINHIPAFYLITCHPRNGDITLHYWRL